MFEKKTIFVVGAGASKEFGFPLGWELRDQIRALLKIDTRGPQWQGPGVQFLRDVARDKGREILDEYVVASKALYDNLPYFKSIDDFLFQRQTQPRVVELGKLAIAKLILDREQNSELKETSPNRRITDGTLKDTWLFAFVVMLVRGRALHDLESLFDNIGFVSFNYDRVLERFLTLAISEVCEVSQEVAIRLVSEKVFIHHAYGSLGPLPGFATKGPTLAFGARGGDLSWMAGGLKTYTESQHQRDAEERLKAEIGAAERLIFLGYGFHPQNMTLLTPANRLKNGEIIATVKDMEAPNVVGAKAQLSRFATMKQNVFQITMEDATCSELFRRYSMALTN